MMSAILASSKEILQLQITQQRNRNYQPISIPCLPKLPVLTPWQYLQLIAHLASQIPRPIDGDPAKATIDLACTESISSDQQEIENSS